MSGRRTSPDLRQRDAAIRTEEASVYDAYGLDPQETTIDVETGCGRTPVRITEFGKDRPGTTPCVVLHGVGSATVLGAPFIEELARGRRIIAVDWPGHGLSGRCVLPAGLGIRRHATTTVRSLLDRLNLEAVDLVGHSMGAQFALYSCHDLGARIRRAALLGAPGAGFAGVRPVAVMKVLAIPGVGTAALKMPLSEATFLKNQDLVLGAGALDGCPPAMQTALHLIAGRTANASSIASFFRALIKLGNVRPDVALTEAEIGRIIQPVLHAWGDLDVFMAPQLAARSVVSLPDLTWNRLPTSGHAPWLQTDGVGAALARHFDSP